MRNQLFKSALLLALAAVVAFAVSYILEHTQPIDGIEFKVFNPLRVFLPSSVSGGNASITPADSLIDGKMNEVDSILFAHIDHRPQDVDSTSLHSADSSRSILRDIPSEDIPAGITDYSVEGDLLSVIRAELQVAESESYNIAFIGDSFIEGDILVERFRNLLQEQYGGLGVGFVPLTSETARFRRTVKHQFSGAWQTTSALHPKKGSRLLLSGQYQEVKGPASVTYNTISKPANLSFFERATLLYEANDTIHLSVKTNEAEARRISLPPDSAVLHLTTLSEGQIHSLSLDFTSAVSGRLHGVILSGDHGVNVDNYSLRGASGLQLAGISSSLAHQLNEIRPYHLIILSYGLNVVSSKESNDSYDWYFKSMSRALQHIKELFPHSTILIMSISDRATTRGGEVHSLSGVVRLLRQQHLLAQQYRCLFFNTYGVMKEMGGIGTFVEKGWAAKDYTHMSATGGAKIADALYNGLVVK